MAKGKAKEFAKNQYQKFATTSEGKQRAITYIAYALIVAVVILSALLDVLIDLENFDSTRFATNLAFNTAIAILTMILSMRDGDLTNETAKTGDYYDVKKEFKSVLRKLVNRDMFRQYCELIYARERESYVMDELAKVNVYEVAYLKVSDEDFELLKNEPKSCVIGIDENGKEILKPLDALTESQADALEYYRSGKFTFEKLDYTFFTSQNAGNQYRKQAKRIKHQRQVRVIAILYRVGLLAIVGLIFSLIAINTHEGGDAVKQAIFDTISRLLVMVSSMFMGYTIANDQAKENTESLSYKIEIINQYFDDKETGAFVPRDYDDIVLEKIQKIEDERKKQHEEEERKRKEVLENTITPEVVKEEKEKDKKEKFVEIEMTESQLLEFQNKDKEEK